MGGERGFTLVEAMVVLSILAITASVALPSFRDLQANRQVSSAAQAYLASLRKAQSEAVARNRNIEVMFTAAAPKKATTVIATPASAAAARRWMVRERTPADTGAFVDAYAVDQNLPTVEMAAAVTSIGFTPLGRAVDFSTGQRLPLAGNAVVSFTHVATGRRACAYLTPGGSAGVCDPARAAGEVQACMPALAAGEC